MIILDTNVLSELMKAHPSVALIRWADSRPPEPVATTAVTIGEIFAGLSALPNGRRKSGLIEAFESVLDEIIGDILPYDQEAAETYGVLHARLRGVGSPIGISDTMIAAITLTHQATLITRNLKHFKNCGIEIIDPFSV